MISKISGDCGTNQRVSDCQSELRYHPDSGDCIIKGDLRSPSSTFYKKVKFWLFFTKKNAGILGNKEPILCLSRYKSPEIFVFVQKILILISMAGEGAVLIDENGRVYEEPAPKGKLINGVGAGDSMVAGFMAGYMEKQDYQYAFHMGIAAGSASAFSENLATREEIEAVYQQIIG